MEHLIFRATVALVVLMPVLTAAVITTVMARIRMLQSLSIPQNGIRLSVVIAALRLPLVVWASIALRAYPDCRQAAGYFVLYLNSSSEVLLASSWRNEGWVWSAVLSTLVILTSAYFFSIIDKMRKRDYLGSFEVIVMLALIRLGDRAYGVPISLEITQRTGREVALGSVYAALERLEEKGLVSSELGEPTTERGGRAKRYFHVTG